MSELQKIININGKKIGGNNRPYIIAEMACAHDGSFEKVKQLIDASVAANADAVQLQFFDTDSVVTPHHDVYDILKNIQFNAEQWTELFEYGKKQGIDVFVCTYDVPSVDLALKLKADGIKLNSSDLNNPDVLVEVAKTGIPFTLGAGASTLEEISNGLRLAVENGATDVILMHGVQNFPTKTEDLNIQKVELLKDVFEIPVGYHDHTEGEDPFSQIIDLVAVGMGANVIEKHITMDRSEKGIDYQAALEPTEFKKFVESIHRAYVAIGSKEIKPFTASELRYRKFQKKSVVAAQDMEVGTVIDKSKVLFIRNSTNGVAPIKFDLLEGKTTGRLIKQFENILLEDIV